MEKEYYLGLDIGTDSIGWAVTDTNYKILKFNGNAMWEYVCLMNLKQPKIVAHTELRAEEYKEDASALLFWKCFSTKR